MNDLLLLPEALPILDPLSTEVCLEKVGCGVGSSIQSGRSLTLMHWLADNTNALDSHAIVLIRGAHVSRESAVGAR